MSLQDLLNTFASQITLPPPGGGATAGALITVRLTPDPLKTVLGGVPGLTRTTVLLKMLRFSDASLPGSGTAIADFVASAGQVLGGQAMPAISVELPGPALPGARIPVTQLSGGGGINSLAGLNITEDVPASATLPSQPSLGQDPATDTTHDVLSGVPGIVGVIETAVSPPTPLRVSLNWTFAVTNGPTATLNGVPISALSLVPPVMFADAGTTPADSSGNPLFSMQITVKGAVYVPNPADPANPGAALASMDINLGPATVSFPGIPIARFLCLFTWPRYGAEYTSGDTNPDDDSLLVMFPAGAPSLDPAAAMSPVRQAAGPFLSLLGSPLGAGTVTPFASPAVVVQQLSALLAGLDSISSRLSVAFHGAYKPVVTTEASAPSPNSPTRGGITNDLNESWWDSEPEHDYYHDHAKSFLWLAPPGGQVLIYRDKDYKWITEGSLNDHGRLVLTTGDTCLAAIAHFRPQPDTLDPNLSPNIPGLTPASAQRDGWFTNEHPPSSEDNWAWTDSVEFR